MFLRLVIGAAFAVGLPIFVLFNIYLSSARQELLQSAKFVYREWVDSALHEMERETYQAMIALHALSNSPEVRNLFFTRETGRTLAAIDRRLDSFLSAHPLFSGVAVLDNTFTVLAARCQNGDPNTIAIWEGSLREPQQPFGTMTQFPTQLQKVFRPGNTGVNEPNMRFLLPIYNRFSEISGLLALDLPVKAWSLMLDRRYRDHRYMLFDQDGQLLAHNLYDAGDQAPEDWFAGLLNDEIGLLRIRQGSAIIQYQGEDALLVTERFTPPSQADFFLQFAAVVPLDELFAPINRLRLTLGMMGVLLLALGLAFAALYFNHVVRPLTDLAGKLSTLDPRSPQPVPSKALQADDEVGLVARALDSLQVQLQNSFKILDAKIVELELANVALEKAKLLAEEAARAKSDFLSVMSHEIRTPLNAIVGYAQLLRIQKADPEVTLDYTQRIIQSSDRLLELIDRILDFSRLNAGSATLQWAPVIIEELLHSIARDASLLFDSDKVEFVSNFDPSCKAIFQVDRVRLGQILSNLLNNAAKFTKTGRVVFTASVDLGATTLPILIARIEDTGIGIEEDKKEAIFQPFVQVDSSSKRKFQGAGLGLAIVAKLIALMQGSITCDSTPGKGSTFEVRLPLRWEDDPAPPCLKS